MTLFAQFDVKFPFRPDLAGKPLARALYFQIVCWSRDNATDGVVLEPFLPAVAVDIPQPRKHMEALTSAKLVEKFDEGWRIPLRAWVKWNPTSSELENERSAKSVAGVLGNHKRWHTPGNPNEHCELCHQAGWLGEPDDPEQGIAPAIAPAIANPSQTVSQNDRNRIARPQTSDLNPINVSQQLTSVSYPQPVERETESIEQRRTRIVNAELALRRKQHTDPIRYPQRWDATVRNALTTDHAETIDHLCQKYPDAPDDVIRAAAIHNETRSLAHYQPPPEDT